jgi:hypothetical protein
MNWSSNLNRFQPRRLESFGFFNTRLATLFEAETHCRTLSAGETGW